MDKRNFLCNLCSGRYADKFQLEEHTIRVHGLNISDREVLKCNLCPYNTFKKSSMTLHMSSKHNETKTHQCLVCNKFFKNEGSLHFFSLFMNHKIFSILNAKQFFNLFHRCLLHLPSYGYYELGWNSVSLP